jgi:hypothetical protein
MKKQHNTVLSWALTTFFCPSSAWYI